MCCIHIPVENIMLSLDSRLFLSLKRYLEGCSMALACSSHVISVLVWGGFWVRSSMGMGARWILETWLSRV